MTPNPFTRQDVGREGARRTWQSVATADGTYSVVDLARKVAVDGQSMLPYLRALSVEPLYVRSVAGAVPASEAGDTRFVHAYTSPVRLLAGLGPTDLDLSVTGTTVAQLATTLPGDVGLRVDPGTEAEMSLDPDQVREVAATSSGVATRLALTAAPGEELRMSRGPEVLTDLDSRVREAVGPDPAVARSVASLDGVGGRDWPVYVVTGAHDTDDLRTRVNALGRLLLVVDGEPEGLLRHLGGGLADAFAVPGAGPTSTA